MEVYVSTDWKDKKIPDKTETDAVKILQRKEMKKTKAIFVHGTKDLPNMLVKEELTPYGALQKLREKYAIKNLHENFDTLDNEWNQFKIKDISMDQDLIFKTLEEQSKRLSVFGDQYAKDELQMLSKLKYDMPEDYGHVFTYLNTNKERQKLYKEQLETAKVMKCSYYKTKITANSKVDNSMVFMIGKYRNKNYKNTNVVVCDFYKKPGHPMIKNGKPFCFKYKKKLEYDACASIKSAAKPIPRTSKQTTSSVGEQMGLDISGPFLLRRGKNHQPVKQKLHTAIYLSLNNT